jgi:hypothetical protein
MYARCAETDLVAANAANLIGFLVSGLAVPD